MCLVLGVMGHYARDCKLGKEAHSTMIVGNLE